MKRKSKGLALGLGAGALLAGAAAFFFLAPKDYGDGRPAGWTSLPVDFALRPVRKDPLTWQALGPRLTIEAASARVTVIPEDRTDIAVDGAGAFTVTRQGADVTVSDGAKVSAGKGDCAPVPANAPALTVRVPRTADIAVRGGAVDGAVGLSNGLSLVLNGCGAWTVADVAGELRLASTGGASIKAADAARARARVLGAGKLELGRVPGELDAYVDGSGSISAQEALSRLDAELWGKGQVRIAGGATSRAMLFADGDGRIVHRGDVATLSAEAHGKSRIEVKLVRGTVDAMERDSAVIAYERPSGRNFCRGAIC